MTLDDFKQKYIDRYYIQEKGITVVSENHLKKIIKLSEI